MEAVQAVRAPWLARGVLDEVAIGLPARVGAAIEGTHGCVRFVRGEEALFGTIELDEPPLPGVGEQAIAARPLPIEIATSEAYEGLFGCMAAEGYPYLARVWNFIPDIIGEQGGHERYRLFNSARQAAFAAAGRTVTGDVPAATGIGLDARRVQIHFIATRVRPMPIENPRQVSAFHYPTQYGPKSPTFARAVVVPFSSGPVLLVSGTASIVGHETVHRGDVVAQARETFANLRALIDEANRRVGGSSPGSTPGHTSAKSAPFSLAGLSLRVYIRKAPDFAAVREVVDAHHEADNASRLYVRGDICRPDLLVEIEASGHGQTVAAR
ncbi:chorismate lyase / 3-hydroxybenzoate synthase [Pararobbsia alpina]|uniref:chorismate transformation enzyme, FkbO/Hyg5 family n=1 Tax=Pararobbsia alpina TaxID=621374 RepID=UPI0039A7499F